MRPARALALALALAGCAHAPRPANPQPARARRLVVAATAQGPVAGVRTAGGLNAFLGIPYAAPPVGELRFAPPAPVTAWTYVRPADRFAPTCPQAQDEFEPASLLYQDEDCLALNVWTPGADAARRPVVVYIHGGGFLEGGSSDPLYDGEQLAKRGGIVVVSLNYRVGAFGFLTGNVGLRDQIAALRWVRENVAGFGGDPDNVTIMGESAGSASVMFLMLAPQAKGLFRRAIAESGAINIRRTPAQAAHYARLLVAKAGAKSVEELRALPMRRLLDAQLALIADVGFEADLLFAPVADGGVVPADPERAFADGAAAGIAFLNGTNADEYRYWSLYFPYFDWVPPGLVLASAPEVKKTLGTRADAILDHYRSRHSGWGDVTFALVNDLMFRVPHLRVADAQSRHAPVFMYRFDWRSHADGDLGACHAIELPFVFRTFDSPTSGQIVGPNPPLALSDAMMDAWLGFIRTGDPAHAGLAWPAYETGRRATLVWDDTVRVQDDPDGAARHLYEGIGE
jgi:para-nitrobenzyl esterase